MTWVLTLIAGSGATLDAALMEAMAARLRAAGATLGDRRWLAPAQACDQFFQGINAADAEALVAAARELLSQGIHS